MSDGPKLAPDLRTLLEERLKEGLGTNGKSISEPGTNERKFFGGYPPTPPRRVVRINIHTSARAHAPPRVIEAFTCLSFREPPCAALRLELHAYSRDGHPNYADVLRVDVMLPVIDRDNDRTIEVRGSREFPIRALHDIEPHEERIDWVASAVRDLVREALLHELDESFHVDGVRAYDPHAPPRKFEIKIPL